MNKDERSISLKVVNFTVRPKEIRRIRVSEFEELAERVKSLTKMELKDLTLQYVDEDKDWITFDSKAEFEEIRGINLDVIRVRILSKKAEKQRFPFPNFRRAYKEQKDLWRQRNEKIKEEEEEETKKNVKKEESKPEFPHFMKKWCHGFRKKNPMIPPRVQVFHPLFKNAQRPGCQFRRNPFGGFGCPRRRGGGRKHCGRFRGHVKPVKCHKGIVCDGCGKKNWVGKRLKCQTCRPYPGYDFCGKCFSVNRNKHDFDHEFKEVPMKPAHPNCPFFMMNINKLRCEKMKEEAKKKKLEVEVKKVLDLPPVSGQKVEEKSQEMNENLKSEDLEEEEEVELPPIAFLEEEEEEKVEEVKFANEMKTLEHMGFADKVLNGYLLKEHNGDVQKIVSFLLRI